ncbi:MAG: hypothetical protein FWC43_14535 [Planctomycetaceae bacterium]|nr:hypothetical protein [Planctomycetaceae bacterium]
MKLEKVLKFKGIGHRESEIGNRGSEIGGSFSLITQSVDKFTIFTDFTVISLRFIPAFIGGDE